MAIKLNITTPKKALNKAYLKLRPLRSEMDLFKSNLIILLDKVKNDESEEHQKNNIRDFLLNTFYKATNEINTKGRQDLVIHTDKTTSSNVGVIIEAKRPSNKAEWISGDKVNAKAFQELVLYYMRERVDAKNIDIKYLVATNINEWYIFDAANFDKLFYGNKKFVKQYEEWRDGKKVTKDTALFYNDIAKPFIDDLEDEIPAIYFDIRDYEKELRNEDKADDKKLIALQKLLSPYHLMRIPFANDSNELNSRFYKELLHIIGLEEVKDGGKQIIRRKSKDASEGSMIENTINILKTEDTLFRLKNKQVYGDTKEEQYFNIALELNLTWINRILFLKLLEGQLLSYHKNDRKYNFLNKEAVFDYDEIYKLFHQVLAKTIDDRSANIIQKYQWVPYLNSSLFEISELENQTIKINSLDDHANLEVINGSILSHLKNQSINPLQYLFEFLDAYDFASEGVEEVQEDSRTLINASILGKIFEKINGYKDGSIYTPGFITMYMCRESIRRAIVQKFVDTYSWDIKEFGDIRNYIVDRRSKEDTLAFNALINSLRLCDPAVGSGHFLVSALNEIILIKYELGILCDCEGVRINEYDLTIENDELIVTYLNGDIFEYQIINEKPKSKEDQRLQKTLFHEKQAIIENCLFGVDINPNSVKICRLRLWIELLKNAYYKEETNYTELETLPNIDINIKCGNSLISRFGLDVDLSTALKSIKYDIKTYRGFVQDYKNCKDREAKRGIEEIINAIKNDFRSEIGKKDKDVLKLNALSGELFTLVNQQTMFETEKEQKVKAQKIKKLEEDINTISAKIEEVKSNAIYRDAFEWRFEFPEVLNDQGDFVGFDVVVGNPPYIRQEEFSNIKPYLKGNYDIYHSIADLLTYFVELSYNILKADGILHFIISNKFTRADYGKVMRQFLLNKTTLTHFFDFSGVPVFDEATVDAAILGFEKSVRANTSLQFLNVLKDQLSTNDFASYSKENVVQINQKSLSDSTWSFQAKNVLLLKEKVESQGLSLGHWNVKINRGVLTGLNEAFIINKATRDKLIAEDPKSANIIKPMVRGRDIQKFSVNYEELYLIGTFPAKSLNIDTYSSIKRYLESFGKRVNQTGEQGSRKKTTNKWFETQDNIAYWKDFEKPKMMYPEMTKFLNFAYDDQGFYSNNKVFILTGEQIEWLVCFFNSKLWAYCFSDNFPELLGGTRELRKVFMEKIKVKKVDDDTLTQCEVYIKRIKAGDESTREEIDQMVYELYGLTEDEIKVVENG